MPLSPEWAKLPKRRCDDCGKMYKQVRPRREGEMGFCSDNCRKSYHKHGGAYRKLKVEMRKMVEKEFGHVTAELRELRQLWIDTESRFVTVSTRLDELSQRVPIRRQLAEAIQRSLSPLAQKIEDDAKQFPRRSRGVNDVQC